MAENLKMNLKMLINFRLRGRKLEACAAAADILAELTSLRAKAKAVGDLLEDEKGNW